jgi:hypothetical protein
MKSYSSTLSEDLYKEQVQEQIKKNRQSRRPSWKLHDFRPKWMKGGSRAE